MDSNATAELSYIWDGVGFHLWPTLQPRCIREMQHGDIISIFGPFTSVAPAVNSPVQWFLQLLPLSLPMSLPPAAGASSC
jgi:hypothetical protein